MTPSKTTLSDSEMAQVAIPQKLLANLVSLGLVHGNECRCLNATAKNVLWQSLLKSSVNIHQE